MAFSFNIAEWHAWAPGLSNVASWRSWAQAPYLPDNLEQQPDVSFLPAMQRRRLTHMARMCFAAAWPLAQGREGVPMVFGSRHGETALTLGLLSSLGSGEPLSPIQFGLSVHNAVGGLWAIQRADTAETCALAATQDSLEHVFMEACGLLHDGESEVIALLAEDAPAPLYRPWITDVAFPHAVAFRLTRGDDWSLSTSPAPAQAATAPRFGHVLDTLRAVLQGERSWTHDCPPRCWTWQRLA